MFIGKDTLSIIVSMLFLTINVMNPPYRFYNENDPWWFQKGCKDGEANFVVWALFNDNEEYPST